MWSHHCRPLKKLWWLTQPREWIFVVLSVGPQPLEADEAAVIRQGGNLALNPVRLLRLRQTE